MTEIADTKNSQATLQDWFNAALLHDIGKTLIGPNGWWTDHEKLKRARNGNISYASLLSSEMIDQIQTHGWKPPQSDPKVNALIMADRLQKAMYEAPTEYKESAVEDEEILEDRIKNIYDNPHTNPPFFPYYGNPMKWDQSRSAKLASEISVMLNQWKQQPTLQDILALERRLVHSPHTSPYIPHNSLAFHQRFTTIFFYFIYRQLVQCKSVDQWQKLELAVVTIKPDPLSLFYRLKDVKAYEETVRTRLRNLIFERVFKSYTVDLPQMTVKANPFEFFGRDAIVLVVENATALLENLQKILDEDETESLRHLTVDTIYFTINKHDSWTTTSKKWEKVPSRNVTHRSETIHILSSRATRFEIAVTPRCERCGQPLLPTEASQGNRCEPCILLMKQTTGVGGDIESQLGEDQRRGFVFLNLPENLLDEAKYQADVLLAELKKDTQRFKPKPDATTEQQAEVLAQIQSTPTGIFEYLQAVMEIAEFQQEISAQSPDVFRLLEFPTLMIWVTNESHYWDFIVNLGEKLKQLHLSASLSGLLCHPSTPFWSLMDRLTKFTQQEGIYNRGEFYDLSGGEIMVFTDAEVKAIRDLAQSAYGDMAFKSQLNALVQLARVATLRELELEIDERDNLRKLRSDFCAELKSSMNRITGDDQRSRDKRALFIKNIVRLAGFQKERGQSSRPEGRR